MDEILKIAGHIAQARVLGRGFVVALVLSASLMAPGLAYARDWHGQHYGWHRGWHHGWSHPHWHGPWHRYYHR